MPIVFGEPANNVGSSDARSLPRCVRQARREAAAPGWSSRELLRQWSSVRLPPHIYGASFPLGRRATGCSGVGAQPAIHRAWFLAMALSVIPGNRLRSSTAADASPSRWYTSRIAAASASVTTYM